MPLFALADTTPPTIVAVAPSAPSIWPPDHKMVPVTIDTLVIDDSDAAPLVHIIGVSSNQPPDNDPDWEITGPLTLNLRAERTKGEDRVYTITIEAVDASGNRSQATTTVTIMNNGGKPIPF